MNNLSIVEFLELYGHTQKTIGRIDAVLVNKSRLDPKEIDYLENTLLETTNLSDQLLNNIVEYINALATVGETKGTIRTNERGTGTKPSLSSGGESGTSETEGKS